jgi:hypothetical protein
VSDLTRQWLTGLTLTIPLVAGCATAAPKNETASRVSVVFIEPEKFTDARRASAEPTSPAILRELEKYLVDRSTLYVPEPMMLNIRIVNIDLAGDFELFRGPHADQVRVTKDLYPPRIVLEFELLKSPEKVIKAGKRELTDMDYQLRVVYPREDYLRYEKELLSDWLRQEFSVLERIKAK